MQQHIPNEIVFHELNLQKLIIFAFIEIVEAWGSGEANAETKARIKVHLDGEEHWTCS